MFSNIINCLIIIIMQAVEDFPVVFLFEWLKTCLRAGSSVHAQCSDLNIVQRTITMM